MKPDTHISVSVFKAQALNLLDGISRTGKSLVVTRHGKPLARVVPFLEKKDKAVEPGQLKHTLMQEEDIVSPLGSGFWSAAK